MSNQVTTVQNLVELHNQQPTTTSLLIAEHFGKQHAHVLRSIANLDCSDAFLQSNFGLQKYEYTTKKGQVRTAPMYFITQAGFAFLVGGFTGKEAAQWKESFIGAFQAMQSYITETITKPTNQAEAYWFSKRPHWRPIRELAMQGQSNRDIATHVGRSIQSVRGCINRMVEVGLINPKSLYQVRYQPQRAEKLCQQQLCLQWGVAA